MQYILRDIPIGSNIRRIRLEKKMSQREVEIKMQLMGSSIPPGTLWHIEAGRRNIKASDLKALKLIFDVPYDEFFKE